MATRMVVSQEINQAHANQIIDISGAVTPRSRRWSNRVSEAEPSSSTSERPMLSLFQRCARLCVLIEPNPAGRAVRLDLAGVCIEETLQRLREGVRGVMTSSKLDRGRSGKASFDAVSTYNLCSCGPELR